MSGSQRVGGIIEVKVGAVLQDAKGEFSYNLGLPLRKPVKGAGRVHGFSEEPQVAFIEGAITDRQTLDLASLLATDGATVTLTLANGKVILLRDAWFAADGTGKTEEGEIAVRFESKSQAEEVA